MGHQLCKQPTIWTSQLTNLKTFKKKKKTNEFEDFITVCHISKMSLYGASNIFFFRDWDKLPQMEW